MWSTAAWGQAWLGGCPLQPVPAHETPPGSLDREHPSVDPARLSHSGSAEWSPSQPECRRFPEPSQVNLCPVSPLQGQEAFISSATPQPGPGAAPWGRGAPHSHPGCHIPNSSPPTPPPVPSSLSPGGMRVGPGEPRACPAAAASAAPGAPRAGRKGLLTPSCNKLLALSGGLDRVCVHGPGLH